MIPKTLSASSVLVSEACMARWKAENFDRAPRMSSAPADVGTTVHYALEKFVKAVYLEKTVEWSDLPYLLAMYDLGYVDTFRSGDFSTPEYADGKQLTINWWERNPEGLTDTVISCEVKESFPIKTSVGEIPFNYIFDRQDQNDETTFTVVDYKSIRGFVRPEDLRMKPQPRAYALAMQIKYPHAERIWVKFDMLRHDGLVGVVFTRDDNKATYRYLQRAAERIIATDEELVQATINAECKWCILKSDCPTLQHASQLKLPIASDLDDLADRKLKVSQALEAIKYADAELDEAIQKELEQRDVLDAETERFTIEMTARGRRGVNSDAVAAIVGPDLAAKYATFNVTTTDQLLRSGDLTDEQVFKVKQQIYKTYGEPTSKVKRKDPFDV